MTKPLLIVGHGLAGCVLALTCYRRNIPFSMVGMPQQGEASQASSGLINPVTGRRYVKAWMIDELINAAEDFYRWSESLLGGVYFYPVEIVRFLSNQEAHRAWSRRLDDPEYARYISAKRYPEADALMRAYGIVTGGYRLDTPGWVRQARRFLTGARLLTLTDMPFTPSPGTQSTVIYATGAIDTRWMPEIIPNRGEALIARLPDWKIPVIVKEEVFIIPLGEDHTCWIGSYYEPGIADPSPTTEGRDRLLRAIRKIYDGRLEIRAHLAGVRPTVDDRRPLAGPFPGHPGSYLFNGMGTKGTSLAPLWADALVRHITENASLPGEVLPSRFTGAG